jgi:PIN domain nuclease of toxin-antitoxin system
LPRFHGEPFDRMLIAQARVEGLRLMTADLAMEGYDVMVVRP